MLSPTVTVIIPAFKAAHTIKRALDSVLAQSCQTTQILVIDDGSLDDITSAVRPYGDRVTLLHKSNGGAASARNLGLDRAKGELVAFLDADDYWEAHKLDCQLALARTHREVGIFGSRWFTQRPNELRVIPTWCTDGDLDRVVTAREAEVYPVALKLLTSTLLVRRDVIGRERFTPGLEPAEDRDLWIRLVAATSVFMTSEPLVTYVEEADSLSRSNVERDYANQLRVIRRYSYLLGQNGVRYWEAETYRRWAGCYLGQGRPAAAVWPSCKRLLRNPLTLEGWWILLKSSFKICTG